MNLWSMGRGQLRLEQLKTGASVNGARSLLASDLSAATAPPICKPDYAPASAREGYRSESVNPIRMKMHVGSLCSDEDAFKIGGRKKRKRRGRNRERKEKKKKKDEKEKEKKEKEEKKKREKEEEQE